MKKDEKNENDNTVHTIPEFNLNVPGAEDVELSHATRDEIPPPHEGGAEDDARSLGSILSHGLRAVLKPGLAPLERRYDLVMKSVKDLYEYSYDADTDRMQLEKELSYSERQVCVYILFILFIYSLYNNTD